MHVNETKATYVVELYSRAESYPSCLQTLSAATLPKPSAQIYPQSLLQYTNTMPLLMAGPSIRRNVCSVLGGGSLIQIGFLPAAKKKNYNKQL